MKSIVILGAGTGGALIANMLQSELDLKEWQITIIDKAEQHLYQPGLLFIPFGLYGYKDATDIARPISRPLPEKVRFVKAEITLIDHEQRKVETTDGSYAYDWLVSSLGCHIAPEEIGGLEEAWGRDVHTFYRLDDALKMQAPLEAMNEGHLVIDIADMPIKCPVAPIEFAFLADYYFSQRGIRDKIDITLVTPFSGAFTKPIANSVLSKLAREKNINVAPNFALESVDADNKVMHSLEGGSLEYDLLCVVPPNLGPAVVEESGLGDGTGYLLTDPRTLKSRKTERMFVIGDNSNVATSKAGSVTHFEAETVVNNLLREIKGEKAQPTFDGHANCFIETGYHKAMLIDFNYDMEPIPGSFPTPGIGPFSLLKESYINHMGKMTFDWVYWNMLLPGYLPHVPMLPSHMNFLGKDLSKTPAVRHARAMRIEEAMTSEVVTIKQGAPLTEAAQLMSKHNVSGLPVVDVDDKLVGIITEADFLSAMNVEAHSLVQDMFQTIIRRRRASRPMGTIVDDLMTSDPYTLKPDDSLQRAIEIMDRNKIKRIVITDDDARVAGLISRADLPKLFLMKG